MAWLVRLVDPLKGHPQTRIRCVFFTCSLNDRALSEASDADARTSLEHDASLPLPDETPEVFRMLPEFLIEDITEFLSFTSKCVLCSPPT